MKRLAPLNWFVFGILAFPALCLVSSLIVTAVRLHFGWAPIRLPMSSGWSGIPGMFSGVPLGVASTIVHQTWRDGDFKEARNIAALGGLAVGGLWLWWLLHYKPSLWLDDFGCAFSPLAWSAALLLFALGARNKAKIY